MYFVEPNYRTCAARNCSYICMNSKHFQEASIPASIAPELSKDTASSGTWGCPDAVLLVFLTKNLTSRKTADLSGLHKHRDFCCTQYRADDHYKILPCIAFHDTEVNWFSTVPWSWGCKMCLVLSKRQTASLWRRDRVEHLHFFTCLHLSGTESNTNQTWGRCRTSRLVLTQPPGEYFYVTWVVQPRISRLSFLRSYLGLIGGNRSRRETVHLLKGINYSNYSTALYKSSVYARTLLVPCTL